MKCCKHRLYEVETQRDKQMRSKPDYKTHNYCFPVKRKTASNFQLLFTFTSTQALPVDVSVSVGQL